MSHAFLLCAIDGSVAEFELHDAVAEQMEPFDENDAWFADGSRWDWWMIGGRFQNKLGGPTYMRKRDLDLEALNARRRQDGFDAWDEAHRDRLIASDPRRLGLFYNIHPGQTREQYAETFTGIHPYAFLRDREWHEYARMGWFGCSAQNECKNDVEPCRFVKDDLEAAVVTHNKTAEEWHAGFWQMFMADLPDDTWLVIVDYHV